MDTPELVVDPASPEDLDAVAELAARTFPDACPPDLPAEAIDDFVARHLSPAAFREHLRAPDEWLRVLRRRGAGPRGVLGYALVVEGTAMDPACADHVRARPTAGVSKFYVDPGARGSGAAVTLMDALAAEARERGLESLWLATNVANARARRFYARHGFVDRGTRTFVVGGVDNRDVVLERPLADAPAGR